MTKQDVSRSLPKFLILFNAAVIISLCSGCSEYWWTRGQPPSVSTLVSRAHTKLEKSIDDYASARQDLGETPRQLEKALASALKAVETHNSGAEVVPQLSELGRLFVGLDGRISMGSRAPYGELAGQLRRFRQQAQDGNTIDRSAYGLFTARVMSFLANELSVPAPIFG